MCASSKLLLLAITYCSCCYVTLQWIGLHIISFLICVIMVANDHISDAHRQHVRTTGHH